MSLAYAARVNHENLGAIRSEDPKFDLERFNAWITDNGLGYFLRDEDSEQDCHYIPAKAFLSMYFFAGGDEGMVFRRVTKITPE